MARPEAKRRLRRGGLAVALVATVLWAGSGAEATRGLEITGGGEGLVPGQAIEIVGAVPGSGPGRVVVVQCSKAGSRPAPQECGNRALAYADADGTFVFPAYRVEQIPGVCPRTCFVHVLRDPQNLDAGTLIHTRIQFVDGLRSGAAGPSVSLEVRRHPKLSRAAAQMATSGRAWHAAAAGAGDASQLDGDIRYDRSGRPLLYVRVSDASPAVSEQLRRRGADIVHVSSAYGVVTLAAPAARIGALAELPEVEAVSEVLAPVHSPVFEPAEPLSHGAAGCNPVVSQGDAHLRAALARAELGVDGTGVTVGVLSDSFDVASPVSRRASDDVASGDLPGPGNPCGRTTPVSVLDEGSVGVGNNDEGRALLQIVHDLAPGAALMFASVDDGYFAMVERIGELVDAGADVIVDDAHYFVDPFFQDGPLSVAVKEAQDAGVVYVASAGNSNPASPDGLGVGASFNGYETPAFRPTSCVDFDRIDQVPVTCHNFRPSGTEDPTYGFRLEPGGAVVIVVQWAEPWFGVQSDVDPVLVERSAGGALLLAAPQFDNVTEQVPFEMVSFVNTAPVSRELELLIANPSSGRAPRFKVIFQTLVGVESVEYAAPDAPDAVTGSIWGHLGSAPAVTVAAAPFTSESAPEDFSSEGPVTLYFGPVVDTVPAAALPQPVVLAKPDVTGTDGVSTTFFGESNLFEGTSASAPHVAAVAALMLQREPSATPAEIAAVLASTARGMAWGTPRSVGAGLVDAFAAISAIAAGGGPRPQTEATAQPGYLMAGADGAVYAFGSARWYGNGLPDARDVVDVEPVPGGGGYWLVNSDGLVSAFAGAAHHGNADRVQLRPDERITSLSATPSGGGYWLFTSAGGVWPFGDAEFFGDMTDVRLNGPVLDSIATPTGQGYYMVASDGGIFAFGDARFYGSMGGKRLNAPVQSVVPDGDGVGYWLVASDGGVFSFDAPFRGSMGGTRLNKPITGMVRYGDGYLMVAEDGGIFSFSDLPFLGSLGDRPPARPIVAVAAVD